MRREFAIVGFEGHDAALSRTARVAEGGLAGVFRGQVTAYLLSDIKINRFLMLGVSVTDNDMD